MKTKDLKKSSISWAVKAILIRNWTRQSVKSKDWWANKFQYRKDYLLEYVRLGSYLEDCPKLRTQTRKKALALIRDLFYTDKINKYLESSGG